MSEEGHHELLIIKRHGGGHEDGHHGGVWKIAFADFMTAMMAFFLVMWLISANDKTKATIAKYFNPIELVDSTPQPVGLNDEKKDDPNVQRKTTAAAQDASKPADKEPPPAAAPAAKPDAAPAKPEAAPAEAGAAKSEAGAAKPEAGPAKLTPSTSIDEAEQSARHDEAELIRDPYAVIAEIASKTSAEPPKQSVATAGTQPASGTGAIGLKAGEAFRDPFEPQPLPAGSTIGTMADAKPAAPVPAPAAPLPVAEQPAVASGAAGGAPAPAPAPAAAPPQAVADATPADRADKPLAPAALRAKVAAIVKAATDAGAAAPKLEVRHTEEGTLISLTDSADFAMFGSASARPSAETVSLMQKIGRVLKGQRGGVTIRGFTDGRPFRSDTYDNWRLSTERAHIAQYMLLRGGLEEARIDHVEGYADHRLKNAKDPDAPENRRIEILLRDAAP